MKTLANRFYYPEKFGESDQKHQRYGEIFKKSSKSCLHSHLQNKNPLKLWGI